MQPLLELLRWENKIIARLESELQIKRHEAIKLVDAHPPLIREAWKTTRDASVTADQLIALNAQENAHHD